MTYAGARRPPPKSNGVAHWPTTDGACRRAHRVPDRVPAVARLLGSEVIVDVKRAPSQPPRVGQQHVDRLHGIARADHVNRPRRGFRRGGPPRGPRSRRVGSALGLGCAHIRSASCLPSEAAAPPRLPARRTACARGGLPSSSAPATSKHSAPAPAGWRLASPRCPSW